jgi:hypothetical protein
MGQEASGAARRRRSRMEFWEGSRAVYLYFWCVLAPVWNEFCLDKVFFIVESCEIDVVVSLRVGSMRSWVGTEVG